MDEVALRSHNLAEKATQDGSFEEEIVPIEIPQKKGESVFILEDEEYFLIGPPPDRW